MLLLHEKQHLCRSAMFAPSKFSRKRVCVYESKSFCLNLGHGSSMLFLCTAKAYNSRLQKDEDQWYAAYCEEVCVRCVTSCPHCALACPRRRIGRELQIAARSTSRDARISPEFFTF